MNCYLCNSTKFISRPGEVRDNLNVHVVECKKCGLVTLDDFLHITESHYEEGKMHAYVKYVNIIVELLFVKFVVVMIMPDT